MPASANEISFSQTDLGIAISDSVGGCGNYIHKFEEQLGTSDWNGEIKYDSANEKPLKVELGTSARD